MSRTTIAFSIHPFLCFITCTTILSILLSCDLRKIAEAATPTAPAFLITPSNVHTHTHTHRHLNHRHNHHHRLTKTFLQEKKKKGYQFGDITKSLINKITEKDEYEFGDLSRHIDSNVKNRLAKINNKNKYEFGDLTKYLVQDFTNSTQYKFGDITKEIVNRVKTKEYTMDDMALLVKGLVSFGVGLSPVASFLPVKLLIDLLNYSIAGDLGTKVVSSITLELDKRMKKAITGDEKYQVGDATKKAILNYTGRDEYTFGDITKTTVESVGEYEKQQKEIAHLNQQLKESKQGIGTNTDADVIPEIKKTPTFLSDEADFDKISKDLQLWDQKYLQEINKEKENK